jgi:hypothetical protein
MEADHALRLLAQACHETLDDARTNDTWMNEWLADLERLCGRLQAQLDALPR